MNEDPHRIGARGVAVGLALSGILCLVGCVEHTIRVELRENGSAKMEQSFLADAPVHTLLRRNPDLAASLYAALAGVEEGAEVDGVDKISRGNWEGLAIERTYPTLMSFGESWPFSVDMTETHAGAYEIRFFAHREAGTIGVGEYAADPTLVDRIWGAVFTNGPSISALLSKGLFHGLKIDYTLVVPGEVLRTNGKQTGNTINWHYELNQMPMDELTDGIPGLLQALPAVTLKCKTWPKFEVPASKRTPGGEAGDSATFPWAPASVVPLGNGKADVPQLGARVRSAEVSRTYSDDGRPQKASLNVEVQFSYGNTNVWSLRMKTTDHRVSCPADPRARIGLRGFGMPHIRWGSERVTRGDLRKRFLMELSPDSPRSVPFEEWSFNVEVSTKRTNGVWTLTFPERGHHVISWDGLTEPKSGPDPRYVDKPVVTSLAFVRGADAGATRLIKQLHEQGQWEWDRHGEYLTHPTGAQRPAKMKLLCGATENDYRVTFSNLVLP